MSPPLTPKLQIIGNSVFNLVFYNTMHVFLLNNMVQLYFFINNKKINTLISLYMILFTKLFQKLTNKKTTVYGKENVRGW